MFIKKSTAKAMLASAAFTAVLFATAACLSVPASALPLGAGAGQIGTAVSGAQPLLIEVQLQNALPNVKGGKAGGAAKGGAPAAARGGNGGAPVAAGGGNRGGNRNGGGGGNRGGGGGRGGNNVGLGVAAGVLGVVGGLIAADQQRQYEEREVYREPREVYRGCEGRRSYDPRSGTYVDYEGRVRRCR